MCLPSTCKCLIQVHRFINYQETVLDPRASQAFFAAVLPAVGLRSLDFGAYVDLGWNNGGQYDYTTITNLDADPDIDAPQPLFQQDRRLGWHPGVSH